MKKQYLLTSVAVLSAIAFPASVAIAQQDASEIYSDTSGTTVNYGVAGNYPVVTEILSVPGVTVNGYSYSASSGTFLAADSTGSLEIYGTSSSLYSPTVGDALNISGTYSPFNGIPEIGTITGVTLQSQGNAAPTMNPLAATISQIDVPTIPQSLAAQYLQLDDVTISASASGDSTITAGETFGTADLTLTITDADGNSEELFYYPHDFSVANQNLFGEAILTGNPVDIDGLAGAHGTTPEFIPIDIIPVATPEPTTLSLCAVGGLTVWALRRRKS